MIRELKPALILLLLLTVITGFIYPLLVTGIAQAVMSHRANGSLIERDGKAVGSELIGMPFTSPKYFWPRPSATSPYPKGIEAQTRQVMENLKRVLAGCKLMLQDVVAARVFLTRFERDYAAMNRVYAGYFAADKRPARTCVGVTALARGALVEIDFIARRVPARRRARR